MCARCPWNAQLVWAVAASSLVNFAIGATTISEISRRREGLYLRYKAPREKLSGSPRNWEPFPSFSAERAQYSDSRSYGTVKLTAL